MDSTVVLTGETSTAIEQQNLEQLQDITGSIVGSWKRLANKTRFIDCSFKTARFEVVVDNAETAF